MKRQLLRMRSQIEGARALAVLAGLNVDIMEIIGSTPDLIYGTIHYGGAAPANVFSGETYQLPPGSANSEYHVYAVWWKDANTVWMYHNGAKVAEITTGGAFNEPMYMFFDTEVFTWHGWPTRESLLDPMKNAMLVDWVRSWRLVKIRDD